MNISFDWRRALCLSPFLLSFFLSLSWAGQTPYKLVPSSNGAVVACPTQSDEQSQILVCNGAVYVIVGDEILVPVSAPKPVQQVPTSSYQFPLDLSDPLRAVPGSGVPAGVIRQ